MKNLFLSALLFAGVGMAFTSCNNGAYDADPLTNNSGISNPMNNGNNSGMALGHIKAKFNGSDKDFANAYYNDLMGRAIAGVIGSSASDVQLLTLLIDPYTGVKTYLVNDTASDVTFSYLVGLGTNQKVYGVITKGHLKLEVTEDANNQVKGTFEGVVYNINDNNDSIAVTEGNFFVPKQ